MMRRFLRSCICVSVFLICGAGLAKADPITGLSLAFNGGGTLTGSFEINPGTNSIVSWDLTATNVFGFNGSHEYTNTGSGAGSVILTNSDGDEVLGFDQNFGNEGLDELDIVIACNGTANCLNQATTATPMSFALGSTTPCANGGTLCIVSGESQVVGVVTTDLQPGFLSVSDPPGTIALNVTSTAVGTVYNGGTVNTGGGGTTNTPEPGSLLLLAIGLGGLLLATRRKKVAERLAA